MPDDLYRGDPKLANRLFAARRSAGFRSARAAASKFGWREATYRAHETATRPVATAALRMYAQALGVDEEWLRTGRGRGPALSATRREIFAIRQKAAKSRTRDPPSAAGKRLRLARRLAGFGSVTAAAKYFGFTRTTLNAHEIDQNSLSPDAARIYALAFGADARWLETGALPSGYPRAIERQLGELLRFHSATELEATRALPNLADRRGSPDDVARAMEERKTQRGSDPRPDEHKGDSVAEIAPDQLTRIAATGSNHGARASRWWTFPEGYLSETMGCDPAASVVIALPFDTAPYRRFDRLVIDTRATIPSEGSSYLALDRPSGEMSLLAWGRFVRIDDNLQIIGRISGLIAAR